MYKRQAYIDPVSDSVRVTFDRNVRTEPRNQPDFHTEMVNPSIPFGDRVILELKFTDRFPEWFNGLVSHFGLMQCGAAKYCEGIAGLPGFGLSHAGDFRERMRSSREPLLSQTPCFPGSSDTGNPVAGVSIGSGC